MHEERAVGVIVTLIAAVAAAGRRWRIGDLLLSHGAIFSLLVGTGLHLVNLSNVEAKSMGLSIATILKLSASWLPGLLETLNAWYGQIGRLQRRLHSSECRRL